MYERGEEREWNDDEVVDEDFAFIITGKLNSIKLTLFNAA